MRARLAHHALGLILLLGSLPPLSAEYPRIRSLSSGDAVFRRLQDGIRRFHIRIAGGDLPPPLLLYTYRTREGDDLFSLAARLSLPYEALATLNGIDRPGPLAPGVTILVPGYPGLFVPVHPSSELDRLSSSFRADTPGMTEVSVNRDNERMNYHFYPNVRFHSVERAFFLGVLYRFPLPAGVISSGFGFRPHPLTGERHFHRGIDIAAPSGTEVYAAARGIVRETARNAVYGTYIVLTHPGGHETVYGHLSAVFVVPGQEVSAGLAIGRVGNTGMSTGPHLHFEIRSSSGNVNPQPVLPVGNR